MSGLLTADHLVPLAVIGVVATVAILAVRRHRATVGLITGSLAIGVLAAEVLWPLELFRVGRWSPQLGLPLQLCDAATLVAAAALLSRWWPLAELAYFWACAGSLQALLTPDLPQGFPDLLYFQYYAAHGGVVVAALLLVGGLGLTPRRGAVSRAFVATAAFTALVGIVDVLIGANYMYLRQAPPTPTLLNVLGPWPWYLASATGVALALLLLLDAPFRLARRRRRSDLDLTARDLLDQRSQLAP